jgi:hypothetical protein
VKFTTDGALHLPLKVLGIVAIAACALAGMASAQSNPNASAAQGTTAANPRTDLSFTTNVEPQIIYDASPRTTNPAAQGDGAYAPVKKMIVHESGAATVVDSYEELDCGGSGGCYGPTSDTEARQGSYPRVLAINPVIKDLSFWWITGCTRKENVATCNVYASGPPLSFKNDAGKDKLGFYVNGVSDSSFDTGPRNALAVPISYSAYSVKYRNAGEDSSTPSTGGVIGAAHQTFGLELNQTNLNHDPGPLTAFTGQNNLPVWGFVSTNTPYNAPNPTGGASQSTFRRTAGFADLGGDYSGFVAADAWSDMYVAGWPKAGGGALHATVGYRANAEAQATNGKNYGSLKSCWNRSVWSGGATDMTVCVQYVPASNAANAPGVWEIETPGATIQITDSGQIIGTNASAAAPSYSFAGDPASGVYRDSGGSVDVSVTGKKMLSVESSGVSVNGGAAIATSNAVPQVGTPVAARAACIKSTGPPVVIGYCSTAVDASGGCTCN